MARLACSLPIPQREWVTALTYGDDVVGLSRHERAHVGHPDLTDTLAILEDISCPFTVPGISSPRAATITETMLMLRTMSTARDKNSAAVNATLLTCPRHDAPYRRGHAPPWRERPAQLWRTHSPQVQHSEQCCSPSRMSSPSARRARVIQTGWQPSFMNTPIDPTR